MSHSYAQTLYRLVPLSVVGLGLVAATAWSAGDDYPLSQPLAPPETTQVAPDPADQRPRWPQSDSPGVSPDAGHGHNHSHDHDHGDAHGPSQPMTPSPEAWRSVPRTPYPQGRYSAEPHYGPPPCHVPYPHGHAPILVVEEPYCPYEHGYDDFPCEYERARAHAQMMADPYAPPHQPAYGGYAPVPCEYCDHYGW